MARRPPKPRQASPTRRSRHPAPTFRPQVSRLPTATPLTRDETLKASPRVPIVTPSLEGSIALKSGRIDDLVLTKYHDTVDPNSAKVTLLSPAGSPDPYFAEFGWVAQGGTQVKVPDRDTLWTVESGTALTPETPVTLVWDNGQGLVFHRNISIDKDYMFKVVDEVENKTCGGDHAAALRARAPQRPPAIAAVLPAA